MKKAKTKAGKLLRGVVNIALGNTKAGVIVQTLSGIVKGGIEATPLSTIKGFLDVNEDGKVDFKDIKDLQWEDIAKLVTVGALTWAALHYGFINV